MSDFWNQIEHTFNDFQNLVSDLVLVAEKDRIQYLLSLLTGGAVPFKGRPFYLQNESDIIDIAPHMATLDIAIPQNYQNITLDKASKCVLPAIMNGLEKKILSEEFVHAWGKFNFAYSRVLDFIYRNEAKHYQDNVVKNNPLLVGRHIYAFWIVPRLQDETREDLDEKFDAVLATAIDAETLPWKKRALREMLDKDQVVKKVITDMSKATLRSMTDDFAAHKKVFEI